MTDAAPTPDDRSPPGSRRRGPRVILFILLAAIAITALVGSDRTAAEARSGTSFNTPPTATTPPVDFIRARLATFNLHSGRDAAGADAWADAVDTLRGLDFIALQEVRGALLGESQAEAIGRDLAMPWCFAPSERRFWHGHFGNAALTTLPIRRWRSTPLVNTRGKAYRNYVLTTIDVGGQAVNVVSTHIDRNEDRIAQLTAVGDLFLALPAPAVLMGDLNSTAAEPALRRLLDAPGVIDTHAATVDPLQRIDWILVRGLRVVETGVVDLGASDHPCYWAEVTLP